MNDFDPAAVDLPQSPAPAGTRRGPGWQRRWRRRWPVVTAVVAVLVAIAGASIATVAAAGTATHQSRRTAKPPATATVQRTTLVASRTFTGTLGYGDATAYQGRIPGTVTDLAPVGTVLTRGDVAYRVDNQPVVVLFGPLPPYRDLALDTVGPDVKQFKENLKALGYGGFTVDEKYTDTTVTAVKKWQKKIGLPETGTVEKGRVLYVARSFRVVAHKVGVGDAAPVGAPVFTGGPDARSVTIQLADKDRALGKAGTAVTVRLPSGKTTPGVMTTVGSGDQDQSGGQNGGGQSGAPGGGSGQQTPVVITIADQGALTGVDTGQVTVILVTGEKKNILAVPVLALLAVGDTGYGVEVVDGTGTRIVPVTIGMFASGKVEISGPGITEGTQVGVPAS
jgi:Putative peptidoglycan binding domain